MFPHLITAFIAACDSVTLPIAMFGTPGMDTVLLRVCSVDLEECFWSQVWALYKYAVLVSWSCGPFYPELCGSSPA
ncbi:hypothetical protein YC2023_047048 [Brassica napus]